MDYRRCQRCWSMFWLGAHGEYTGTLFLLRDDRRGQTKIKELCPECAREARMWAEEDPEAIKWERQEKAKKEAGEC